MGFASPLGAALVVLMVVPLAAWARTRRAQRRVRAALRLPPEPPRGRLAVPVAVAAVVALVAAAAAQPYVDHTRVRRERKDAQAMFVIDTSRSMLAARAPRDPTRFARAQRDALELRAALADVPVGIASVTDRALPNLFPTSDLRVFDAVLHEAVEVDRPPPALYYSDKATTLASLSQVATLDYFSPRVRKRLVVVFTDGETQPVTSGLGRAYTRRGVRLLFVHVWRPGEAIWIGGKREPTYHPDPTARALVDAAARSARGRVYAGSQIGSAAADARRFLGSGPTETVREGDRYALMPWVTLAALAPLGLVLGRRNL